MSTIKEQLKREIELRGEIRSRIKGKEKNDLKKIAKEAGIDYNGFLRWFKNENRSMGDKNIDKIASVLNKRFVLIDKNQ